LLLRSGKEIAAPAAPAAAPPGPDGLPLDIALGEVRAASGADGAMLRFIVEDGSLFLRG
jgi:hypothetical protein